MSDDKPTFVVNQDGTIDIPVEGKIVRYAKESDLLAVKGGSETKEREWETEKSKLQTNLTEANRLRDESHQTLLTERAAKEQLEKSQSDYATLKTKVGELETESATLKEGSSKLETELAGRLRYNLVNVYGATEDSIKEKNLDQLRNLVEAAKIFNAGGKGKPARYDGGEGGPGAGSVPETPTDRAKRIIQEHEAKMGRPAQVSNIAIK